MNGKITSLQELKTAADQKRSVVCPMCFCWKKPTPAAFMIHQPGAVLLGLFNIGMTVYQPTPKRQNRIFSKSKKNK